MRRRLQKYLPIILIALMVQILAPVVACWAAAVAASDPLNTAQICHDNVSSAPVVWRDQASGLARPSVGSNTQARAPPLSV